ncbi:four helix bundle protein [Labilibacter marinus]|uniref:four helix bundle protein n=1 Tax=Labilibacter marinus TaxID=1477105 RepID=UPI00094FB29E|nr:four helix bundle protein [Labilibacter marinus]
MSNCNFGFKDLLVWQKSLNFANEVIKTTESLNSQKKHFRLIEQIEASSASVAQNIAEGKGRYSPKEFKQFLYYSRGSLYETITVLNLFYLRNWITRETLVELEMKADEIGKMLNGLINSLK